LRGVPRILLGARASIEWLRVVGGARITQLTLGPFSEIAPYTLGTTGEQANQPYRWHDGE